MTQWWRKHAKSGGLKCTATSHNYVESMATVWNIGGGGEPPASCILWYLNCYLLTDCSLVPRPHLSQGKWCGEPSRILGLEAHYGMRNPVVLITCEQVARLSCQSTIRHGDSNRRDVLCTICHSPLPAGILKGFWSLLHRPVSLLPVF